MIEVKNLTHVYKSKKGIFDVSFEVREGEIFGYLGPNGSGKTTTIRNMMGFVNPQEGSVKINGLDCMEHASDLQKIIGYIPGEMNMLDFMTGAEFLEFMAAMRGMKDLNRMRELVKKFELDPSGKIKKMSKGMKQKLGIIVAFMHDPEIYILDEPTSGLDPLMQNVFMELIAAEQKRGKTILMSSHIFEEVQRSCDRVGIIKEGRIVTIQDIHSLNELKTKVSIIQFGNFQDLTTVLESRFETEQVSDDTLKVKVAYPYNEFYQMLANCDVVSHDIQHISIEDLFLKYYGSQEGDLNE